MAADSDYYTVLGVSRDAGAEQIRKAFRERVRACHPDRVANLDEDLRRLAEEKMVELNEAYAVLRNPARRAAYDDRHKKATVSRAPEGATRDPVDSRPSPVRRGPLVDPEVARTRMGEQSFVARAASEEFELSVKRCVPGQVSWEPLAFDGATRALRGSRGRHRYGFVLLAAPRIDDKRLRRFLRSLEIAGERLKSPLFGKELLFGFVGAVEFVEQGRQRATITRFNDRHFDGHALRPATLVDLVNWHVVPGEISFQDRLENLLRGA